MATENRITALEARIAKLEGRRAKRKHNPGD
jgi:BMFP domain-containing protein YqiC